MKKILLIFLFFPILISAQNFSFGFDTELSYIRIRNGNSTNGLDYETFIPITFNLIAGYNFNKKLFIQARVGETILAIEFSGFEAGLDGIYRLNKDFYVSAGVLHHSNEGGEVSNSHGVTFASLFMLTAGVGYQVTKHYAFELDYYYPTAKKAIVYYNYDYQGDGFYPNSVFDYMIRMHFVFTWEL
jgi:hypothetical protein